tara:strand:+ start:4772 stop:5038 length:267 start_codon:yes stop_codon:yes gene_type:complete
MRLKEIYQYQYDQLIETLDVEFSLHEDSDNSYRLISLIDLEITSYLSNPTILDEFSIEDLMEDIIIVEEIIENYIEINSDDLPKEEFL